MKQKTKSSLLLLGLLVIIGGLLIYAFFYYKKPMPPTPYVFYNNQYYVVTYEDVLESQLGKELTTINRTIEASKKNENGDSNVADLSSKVYQIKEEKAKFVIAVEIDSKFYTARVWVGNYLEDEKENK